MNEILQKIADLRKQDMTFQEIADRFNSESIPTLSGTGKWDKRTIQRKLEQYEHELSVKQKEKEFETMSLQIQEYERAISEKDAVIFGLNRTIEELTGQLANSRPKNPNNFEGWTVTKSPADHKYRIFKKFAGKNIGVYVGKEFDPDTVRLKIAETTARVKQSVVLIPKKRGRKPKAGSESPSLPVIPFETRLRVLCPPNRTYRLDTVRSAFPDLQHEDFDKALLALAGQHKIELLGGDPRECNPADLIKDSGITYVNFQWV